VPRKLSQDALRVTIHSSTFMKYSSGTFYSTKLPLHFSVITKNRSFLVDVLADILIYPMSPSKPKLIKRSV